VANFSWSPLPRLRVQTSPDGKVWQDESVPRWARLTQRATWEVDLTRGEWDLRPDWQWVFDWCMLHHLSAALSITSIIVGLCKYGRASALLVAASFGSYGAGMLAIAASRAVPWAEPVAYLGDSVSTLPILWLRIAFCTNTVFHHCHDGRGAAEYHFVGLAAITAVLVSARARDIADGGGAGVAWSLGAAKVLLAVAVACGVARLILRRLTRAVVLREAAPDARAFAAGWRALLAEPAEVGALARLRLLAREKAVVAAPRQRSADPAARGCAKGGFLRGGAATPVAEPVTSLGFLYGQARAETCLCPLVSMSRLCSA
jgi:hypothetical protein